MAGGSLRWACFVAAFAAGIFFSKLMPDIDHRDITWSGFISLVSAIGTIGAVWAALYLARSSSKRAREESVLKAELALDGIYPLSVVLADKVRVLFGQLAFKDPNLLVEDYSFLESVSEVVEYSAMIKRDNIHLLSPLEGKIAHRVSRFLGLMESFKLVFNHVPPEVWMRYDLSKKLEALKICKKGVSQSHAFLSVLKNSCEEVIRKHDLLPSSSEIHGVQED